ncbi:MAG TPA: DUF4320 family protein [Anaerovoracaceae bacterium]|nr:DUF4320 family protein [Anaerovoracaceae bacterium]
MKSILKKLYRRLRDKGGEMLTHTVLTVITYFILTAVVINVLILTFHFFSLHYTARAVARVIEREGGLTDEAYEMLHDLNDDFHISAELTSRPASKIQYMEPFEVVIEDEHIMTIMTPVGLDPVEYDFPMKATVTGMSEVFWKELL